MVALWAGSPSLLSVYPLEYLPSRSYDPYPALELCLESVVRTFTRRALGFEGSRIGDE